MYVKHLFIYCIYVGESDNLKRILGDNEENTVSSNDENDNLSPLI
jgi:hypothetical protein